MDPEPTAETTQQAGPAAGGGGRWLLFLLLFGLINLAAQLWILKDRDGLATSDEAAYIEQADSLLRDGTLSVGFVRHYHVQYDAGILHPEDFYPPGNGILLALSFRLLGRSEFAAAVPSAILASLILPLLAFLIGRRLRLRPPFAFACGLTVLFEPDVQRLAMQGLADLPFVAFFLLAVLFVLPGRGWWSPLLAGASLALSFYFKPTALLFAPGLALVYWISERRPLKSLLLGWVSMGVAFLLVASPWLVRNQQLFGDPMYSGNKHLSASANDPDFEYDDIRKVYWADPDFDLPTLSGSVERFGWRPVITRFLLHLYEAFISKGGAIFGFWFLLGALFLLGNRRVLSVLALLLFFVLALSAVFAVETRYLLPCVPLTLAIGWGFADRVVAALDPGRLSAGSILVPIGAVWRRLPLIGRAGPASCAALLLVLVWVTPAALGVTQKLLLGHGSFAPGGDDVIRKAGLWVRDNLPADVRVMHQQALRFRFYAGRLTVETPFDEPDPFHAVVEHHDIRAIVFNDKGSYSGRTSRYLGAYLTKYGEHWEEIETGEAGFVVYRRKN